MKSLPVKAACLLITLVILTAGCKQPETIIIAESPATAVPDTTVKSDRLKGGNFQKLVIGEYASVTSLDPLFLNNGAEMRAAQLVYEGLVRFDEKGEIVPAIAEEWKVSKDSLHYRFRLRSDIFYQNSNIFSAGTGRRLEAKDIKFVFERMARMGVPPRAAKLFMDVEGFENYYREQHFVYNKEQRQLEGISGIITPNDSTVIFRLAKPDSAFLKKLASPLALIYPPEAVKSSLSFVPVGTGPFVFSQKTDSIFIFSKFDNYYRSDQIKLDRVDIRTGRSESALFKSINTGETDVLPMLGPRLIDQLLTNRGTIRPVYKDRFNLEKPGGGIQYSLYFNPQSDLRLSTAGEISALAANDSSSFIRKIPPPLIGIQANNTERNPAAIENPGKIFSAFSADPFVQMFLVSLSKQLDEKNLALKMAKIRTPVDKTALFFTRDFPLIPETVDDEYEKLLDFKVKQVVLQRTGVQNLTFNTYPWWIDVRDASVVRNNN